jgi:uncharacterized RDD family membrane protein YckC
VIEPDDPREHEVAEFDVSDLAAAERWELDLILLSQGAHARWRDATLVMSAAHRNLVDEFLESRAATGGPGQVTPGAGSQPAPSSEPQIAGAFRRLVGYILDFAVLAIVSVPVSILGSHTTHPRPHFTVTGPTRAASWLLFGLYVAYQVGAVALFGRTLGQAALRLRVVRSDESPAGWTRAVVRFAVTAAAPIVWIPARILAPATAPWLGLAWPVVIYGWMLFDPSRRGLHDVIAGTLVLHEPRPLSNRQSALR